MTIAEKMLELLDEGWGTKTLRFYGKGRNIAFRCAIGIRLDAEEKTCYISFESEAAIALQGDPVLAVMARIIREQYPGFVADYREDVTCNDFNLVMLFNDRKAELPDIRALIEKTIAEGL